MKLILVNTNQMQPPIAPLGLEYAASAARQAGVDVDVVDLCLADNADAALAAALGGRRADLIGLSVRNVDDCFWPSAAWFVPDVCRIVGRIRALSEAPICLGGVGFSIFAQRVVELAQADFGIRGDGEHALLALLRQLGGPRQFHEVPGLVWRGDAAWCANAPAWPPAWPAATARDMVDNRTYFRLGGQMGIETKRGCGRRCAYCADPLAKGPWPRLRQPGTIADEIESLLGQGIDVLHLCDAEFNIPGEHAWAVCEELVARGLGRRVRWYAYLAVLPFDADLARAMRRAGCVGIDFTGDSAADVMLTAYRQPHRAEDLARAVRLCRENGIAVMVDLLLGGPGETPQTLAETIGFIQHIGPDCAGAALGLRLYPGTPMLAQVAAGGRLEDSPGLRRRYQGPIDLAQPTYYISPALGPEPARLVRDLIAGDQRFFAPVDEVPAAGHAGSDHNYNDNRPLVEAIAAGARGAYWDILRRMRNGAL